MNLLRAGPALVVVFAVGCGSLPDKIDRPVSRALSNTGDTALGTLARSAGEGRPGESGVGLLRDGYQALGTRLDLADMAQRSIDVQTFVWKRDTASRLLAARLLEAADRGARVRVLVDDYHLKKQDFGMAVFDAHPNVEVRIFNPFGTRRSRGRKLELLTDLSRLNHRMHNKVFVVDNQVAIVGGRNVGDEYYGLDEKYNFIDLDVLLCGSAVGEVSASFDEYWNSDWAYPISAFEEPPESEQVRESTAWLRGWVEQRVRELELDGLQTVPVRDLVTRLAWVQVDVTFEDPDKAAGSDDLHVLRVGPALRELAESSESQILLASPYVVVGSGGALTVASVRERGVAVRILTNSMAAADQGSAFSGYSRSRGELMGMGVELCELKRDIPGYIREDMGEQVARKGGLHAKVGVFDREIVYIGTYNLDPRSANINTEIGLIIHDEKIAQEVAGMLDDLMGPDDSWQVVLNSKGKRVWWGTDDGGERIFKIDPRANLWRRFEVIFFSLLPIRDQL